MSLVPHHFHYFSHHINREVKEVYWQAFFANLAISIAYIFEPIYLFSQGVAPTGILLFYGQVYFWYAILIFPVAKITTRIGYKHSIAVANVIYVFYWLTLFLIPKFFLLLYIAPILFSLQKSFFWPAFDSDIAINSEKGQRGREVGALFSLIEGTVVLGPLIGGLLSFKLGYGFLFVVSSLLMLISIYPLFKSPEIYTKHEFRFKNFLNVFRRYKWNFLGYFGYAEDLMIMTLWPIAVFMIAKNSLSTGLLTMFASGVAIVLMLMIGKASDETPKPALIKLSAFAYAISWIFRFLATTVPTVLGFDVVTRTSKGTLNVPMISLTYELAGLRGPDHAIAYSVFYEFSLSIGKIITALLGILILSYTGNMYYVFILAGFLTLFYGLLRK